MPAVMVVDALELTREQLDGQYFRAVLDALRQAPLDCRVLVYVNDYRSAQGDAVLSPRPARAPKSSVVVLPIGAPAAPQSSRVLGRLQLEADRPDLVERIAPAPPSSRTSDLIEQAARKEAARLVLRAAKASARVAAVRRSSAPPIDGTTACLVSHGDAARLRGSLRGLLDQGLGESLRIVVVCNLRGDGSATLVRSEFPSVTVIEQETPRGFGENLNAGFADARSRCLLIANPDVVLAPGCVSALGRVLASRPSAGAVAPTLVYPDGRPQANARRFPEPLGTVVRRTPLRLLLPPARTARWHYLPVPDAPRPIDWALGACLLVRRSTWEELGGFDPEYRLYVEDIDFAWRAWQRGWELWQTPDARATHEHQAVIDREFFSRRTLWHSQGMLRFVRKHPAVLAGARPGFAIAARLSEPYASSR